MERKEEKGKILSIDESFMADYNKENDTERAVLSFIFCADDNGNDDEVAAFLVPLVQRPKTIIIDLASVNGRNYKEKLQTAKDALEGKMTIFTTYTAQISELNKDGKTTAIGENRNYTNYSRSYVGKHNDEKAVLDILKRQLADDIDDGTITLE